MAHNAKQIEPRAAERAVQPSLQERLQTHRQREALLIIPPFRRQVQAQRYVRPQPPRSPAERYCCVWCAACSASFSCSFLPSSLVLIDFLKTKNRS